MTILWERLAGDTGVFALKVGFQHDPESGQDMDPDTALSWGAFQLWVHGKNLCAHLEEGEAVDAIHWYLLPLLEWLARNWNPLLHEERLPDRNDAADAWSSLRRTRFVPAALEADEQRADAWEQNWASWWRRHALRACREGGLFPDIVIRRWRDEIEVSWGSSPLAGMPEHYLFTVAERGLARVPSPLAAQAMFEVLQDATEYLHSLAPQSERLGALRQATRSLRSGRRALDRRLMWLAGVGTDETSVAAGWHRLKGYLKRLPKAPREALLLTEQTDLVVRGSCHATLMFGSVSPEATMEDALTLARSMADLYDAHGDPENIRPLVRHEPLDTRASAPWEQGYALAQELLDRLGLPEPRTGFVDVGHITQALGIRVENIRLADRNIRGVSVAGPQHRPGILVNLLHDANQYPSGYRFTLAHELCHLLFDRGVGRRLALASGPWAPRDIERRANAFAAMLLMPVDLVRAAVGDLGEPLDSAAGIANVAKSLQASFSAVLWHLSNLAFIDESTKERLEREAKNEALVAEGLGQAG